MTAPPGVLSLIFLRTLGDIDWWNESRRAELLEEIRKAATSSQKPPAARIP